MEKIQSLFDALGRRPLAAQLGVSLNAVSNAVSRGEIPASWYFIVKEMAGSRGIDCPDSLFAMKGLSSNATEAAE